MIKFIDATDNRKLGGGESYRLENDNRKWLQLTLKTMQRTQTTTEDSNESQNYETINGLCV